MGDVVEANIITRLNVPAEKVLRKAKEAGLSDVVIVGFKEDGDFYFASSWAGAPDVVHALEKAKLALFDIEKQMEGEA